MKKNVVVDKFWIIITAVCIFFGTSMDFICNKKNGLGKFLRKADLVIFSFHIMTLYTTVLQLQVECPEKSVMMSRLWLSNCTNVISM